MTPVSQGYECKAGCGFRSDRWCARCPTCSAWIVKTIPGRVSAPRATARDADRDAGKDAVGAPVPTHAGNGHGGGPDHPATPPPAPLPALAAASASRPVPITQVPAQDCARLLSGIEPLDRVLGGGFAIGSMVLLGGDPGIGKSTLLIQMMASIPCDRLLYATGEETIGQAAIRAHRVGSAYERIQIVPETDVDLIIEHARAISAQILAVDSIQTMRTAGLPSAPGTVTQVRECTARLMRFAKDTHTTTILVGHVNKDGGLAGPETLQHLVDVILQFEPDPEFPAIRILRVMGKNRFGGTTETGSFEMTSEGLRSISPDDAPEARRERSEDAEDQMTPVAQELLYRFLELGGVVDAGLRDRIGDRLDLIPRSTS